MEKELFNWNELSTEDQMKFNPADIFNAWLNNHHISNTAYPLTPAQVRPYKMDKESVEDTLKQSWEEIDELWLYVHIPFCEKRCKFCEYTVIDNVSDEQYAKYVDLLKKEFQLYSDLIWTKNKKLIWFDIWWWTPWILSSEHIEEILDMAKESFWSLDWFDISIETTPKIASTDPNKLQEYFRMWIRRISMWVQAVNPKILEQIWRTATSIEWNINAAKNIREAGFEKFNIDIMYGFLSQTRESIISTVNHAIELDPDYVTLYRMRYKWTKMSKEMSQVDLEKIKEQEKIMIETLKSKGYEANNWKNTFSKIPNDWWVSDYLTQRVAKAVPYLWIGLWSQSMSKKTLGYNLGAASKDMKAYEESLNWWNLPIQDIYHLSLDAAIWKMISVSFYFWEIDLSAFESAFWIKLEEKFPDEMKFILDNDLMNYTDNGKCLCLTEKWAYSYNWVIALFYSWANKKYLMEKK